MEVNHYDKMTRNISSCASLLEGCNSTAEKRAAVKKHFLGFKLHPLFLNDIQQLGHRLHMIIWLVQN